MRARHFVIPAEAEYVFSQPLVFLTIPKACGFEAATRFTSTLMCGSLIPIVVIGMGMALTAFGFHLCAYYHRI